MSGVVLIKKRKPGAENKCRTEYGQGRVEAEAEAEAEAEVEL